MTDEELFEAAEAINDGWYADDRIDWHDFLDRLESHTDEDLGMDMTAPRILAIKKHINRYRRQG